MTTTRTLRLTDEELATLEMLADALSISGQREAKFQPLIRHLAATAAGAMAETVAALEIASGCAAGGDWDELIEAIRPQSAE
jgi:hypothetical protein